MAEGGKVLERVVAGYYPSWLKDEEVVRQVLFFVEVEEKYVLFLFEVECRRCFLEKALRD